MLVSLAKELLGHALRPPKLARGGCYSSCHSPERAALPERGMKWNLEATKSLGFARLEQTERHQEVGPARRPN